MVKQCKMLTSLNLRWTRWQRESSLCFQHHEAWRILRTRVWNIFSKAEDARTEMFTPKSKCLGWNLHVQLCFIMSFRRIWKVAWIESFLAFWYFDVPHTFIQKKLWLSYFGWICTISQDAFVDPILSKISNLKTSYLLQKKTLDQPKTKFDKLLDNRMPPGAFLGGCKDVWRVSLAATSSTGEVLPF